MMNKSMTDKSWTKEQTAQAMADAIDAFVRGGAVCGVRVFDPPRSLTLAQTGQVTIQ